jgi:hypothetical protein
LFSVLPLELFLQSALLGMVLSLCMAGVWLIPFLVSVSISRFCEPLYIFGFHICVLIDLAVLGAFVHFSLSARLYNRLDPVAVNENGGYIVLALEVVR